MNRLISQIHNSECKNNALGYAAYAKSHQIMNAFFIITSVCAECSIAARVSLITCDSERAHSAILKVSHRAFHI